MIPKLKTFIPVFLVLTISSFIFLYQLGSRSLANWDEAWYADASRFMYRHNHFLTPIWNGQYFFDKPPLQYWLTQPFLYIFGETEIAYRLPSALASIALTVLTFFWGKKRFGITEGISASVVLLSFPNFIDRGRSGNFDGLFIFLTTFSIYLFFQKRPVYGGIFLGLAGLTKGIFSGFFPVVVASLFLAVDFFRFRSLKSLKLLALFLMSAFAVYSPWHLVELFRFRNTIDQSYFSLLDQGTFGSWDWADIVWRFDLRYLVFLWTFLRLWFPVFIIALFWRTLQLNKLLINSKNSPRKLNDYLELIVFLIIFIGLSAAREKNDWYIMPAYPFAALLITRFLFRVFKKYQKNLLPAVIIMAITNIAIYQKQAFPTDNHLSEKQMAELVKKITKSDDLIVTAEYEYPTLIYYSERKVRTAARQPNMNGMYWWIWGNKNIEEALKAGKSIVTIHRPGTEWELDVDGYHRKKITEFGGRIISRLIPD